MRKKHWVIGITGASGVVYGVRLCQYMLSVGETIHLVISDAGRRVLHDEMGWQLPNQADAIASLFGENTGKLIYHPMRDIGASIASGSFLTEGMVILPCSMGTLAAIASGASDNLLERAADVMLKEGRKLIIAPRETPLHEIHLENMLKLSRMGVRIIPTMPAFYQKPKSLDDLVDFMVGKVLDSMNVEHDLYQRWGEDNGQQTDSHWQN